MSSFVTTSKLWLTILIDMYCDGTVREEDHTFLSFIAQQLLPSISFPSGLGGDSSSNLNGQQLTLSIIEDSLHRLEVDTDSQDFKRFGPCSLWLAFVYRHCGIAHLDRLERFITSLTELFIPRTATGNVGVKRCVLTQNSLLGAFVNRVKLSWAQMRFEHQMQAWHELADFRRTLIERYKDNFNTKAMRAYKAEVLATKQEEADLKLEESLYGLIARHHQRQGAPLHSDEDLRVMVQFQVERMQSTGARIDHRLEGRLNSLLQASTSNLSSSHYFRFLSSWRGGDYVSALDDLHRYYDYAMPNDNRSQYPYACLNMAVLQADFECYEEALPAINEAISAARECKDHSCLAFCLSWLHHFSLVDQSAETQEWAQKLIGTHDGGLSYLRHQASAYELRGLESSLLLSQANAAIARGARPLEAFEKLHEASALNLQYSDSGVGATMLLMKSSLFNQLGLDGIAKSYLELITFWYKDEASLDECVQAYCREAIAHVLGGEFEDAEKIIKMATEVSSGNLKQMQIVAQYAGLVNLKKTIARGNVHHAEAIIHALCVAPHPDSSISGITTLCEIDFRIDTGALEAASKLIEDLLEKTEKAPIDVHTPIQLRLRILIAKARLFIAAHRPQKALSLALRARSAAYKAKAFALHWQSLAMLMQVLGSLGRYEVVIELGQTFVEHTRELWDQSVLAEIQTALSDAYRDAMVNAWDAKSPIHFQDPTAKAGQWAAELVNTRRRLQNVAAITQAEAKMDARSNLTAGDGVRTDTKSWDSSASRKTADLGEHTSSQTEAALAATHVQGWDFTTPASLSWQELSLPILEERTH